MPRRRAATSEFSMPRAQLDALLRSFLREDLGEAGDVTSRSMVPSARRAVAEVRARSDGTMAGAAIAARLVRLASPRVRCRTRVRDGRAFRRGQVVLTLRGPLRDMLGVERTLLNLLGRLSGVATATRAMVDAVRGTKARIRDTRKTTPGLRALEKLAVRCGGGVSHRAGLFDAFLAKDNHLAGVAAAQLAPHVARAVARARRMAPLAFAMVEVDTAAQFRALLELPSGVIDAVLLDNMPPAAMRRLVALRDRRAPWLALEASGGVTRASVAAIARTGVDFISAGSITHSAPQVDFGLDVVEGR